MNSAELSLTINRVIPAEPHVVFESWTTPEALMVWWTPPNGRCVEASIDLRAGGRYTIVNALADGRVVTIEGEYLIIEPPSLLRFTWATDDRQRATEVVTVTLALHEGGTELTITHDRIPAREVVEGHQAGWQSCLDGLVEHAAASTDASRATPDSL